MDEDPWAEAVQELSGRPAASMRRSYGPRPGPKPDEDYEEIVHPDEPMEGVDWDRVMDDYEADTLGWRKGEL